MNICIFGDSIVWGAYDPINGGYVNFLRNYFEEKNIEIEIYNLGISGDTSTKLLERLESEAKKREADLIIIAIGINDTQYIHSIKNQRTLIQEFKNNLLNLFQTAKKITNKIIFIGITNVDETKSNPLSWNSDKSYTNENVKKYNNVIRDFCQRNKLKFISLEGIITKEDLFDGLHPNTKGHKKIFETIKKEISNFL